MGETVLENCRDICAATDLHRVSIGAGLSRVAQNAMMTAAQAMKDGNFGFISDMIGVGDLRKAFGEV